MRANSVSVYGFDVSTSTHSWTYPNVGTVTYAQTPQSKTNLDDCDYAAFTNGYKQSIGDAAAKTSGATPRDKYDAQVKRVAALLRREYFPARAEKPAPWTSQDVTDLIAAIVDERLASGRDGNADGVAAKVAAMDEPTQRALSVADRYRELFLARVARRERKVTADTSAAEAELDAI